MGRPLKVRDPAEEKERKKNNQYRYLAKNKDKQRAAYVKRTYGITWDEYVRMYQEQQCSCSICKTPISMYSEENNPILIASVDHCHETGRVRGLLCRSCNTGLGYFKDNPTLCRLAAIYLDRT